MELNEIDKLINLFSRLPGLGQRSARRIILHLLTHKNNLMINLAAQINLTAKSIQTCVICGNLDVTTECNICQNQKRDGSIICIVENVNDLWAMEKTKIFNGKYHVLGGTLSAFERRGPEDLNINNLLNRLENSKVQEIIIATNATLDGQTTAFYLSEKLKNFKIKISKLAHGMPIGGELDYLDEGTLKAALDARNFSDVIMIFLLQTLLILFFIMICPITNCHSLNDDRETYEIHIHNHKFSPEITNIPSNRKIRLIIINDDDEVEEFETIDLKREKIVPPHSKITLLIGPLQPGKYKFFGDFHPETAQGLIIVE